MLKASTELTQSKLNAVNLRGHVSITEKEIKEYFQSWGGKKIRCSF